MAVTVRKSEALPLWPEVPTPWAGEAGPDEKLARAVTAWAPALIAVTDRDGNLVLFNPRCEEVTGCEAQGALGRPAGEVLTEDEAGALSWALEELRAGRAVEPRELACRDAEGRRHLISWRLQPITDDLGRLSRVLLAGEDLTELRAREEAVRAGQRRLGRLHQILRALRELDRLVTRCEHSEEVLRLACSLFTNTRGYYSACVVLVDGRREVLGGEESGIGPDFSRLLDSLTYSPLHRWLEEAMTLPEAQVVTDPQVVRTLLPSDEALAEAGALLVALRHGHRMFGVLCATLPQEFLGDEEEQSLLEEAAAQLALALYAAEEQQAHEAAQATAEQARGQYEALVEATTSWVLICDRERRVRYWNQAAEAASGYALLHLAGNTQVWERLYPVEAYREGIFAQLEAVLLHGEKRSFETTVQCKRGGERVIAWAAAPLPAATGETAGAMLVGQDLTPRKQMSM